MFKIFAKKKLLVTHDGTFHADDVFAAAILELCLEKEGTTYELVRSRDTKMIEAADVVFDVGGEYEPARQRFDHHQTGRAGTRPNGIYYAACGLVWKHFGDKLVSDTKVREYLDCKIFQALDGADNGQDLVTSNFSDVFPYSIPSVVAAFNPTWREEGLSEDEQFKKAVAMARVILGRELSQAESYFAARFGVEEAYQKAGDKKVVLIEKPYSRHDILGVLVAHPEPLYFIYPKGGNRGWKLEAVRESMESFKLRKDLPSGWAGKRDEELQKLTGVSDAVFCHAGLFLATAKSRAGAEALAKLAIND